MKYLIANWKMNLELTATVELAKQYKKLPLADDLEMILAPSLPYLAAVKELLGRSKIKLAAQDVSDQTKGQSTGEVSAAMLKELGCEYVIVGHSERRKLGETNEMIRAKLEQCYAAGLKPILCIGETLEEKNQGQREAVLGRQLQGALKKLEYLPEKELFIAYEPVWAIGSGADFPVAEMPTIYRSLKRSISSLYSESFYEKKVHLLYGGSVDGKDAAGFWQAPEVQGVLIATASLNIEEMKQIVLAFN